MEQSVVVQMATVQKGYRENSFMSSIGSKSLIITAAVAGGIAIFYVTCACCRRKKEKKEKAPTPLKSTKSDNVGLIASIIPPREEIEIDQASRDLFAFAFNAQNWMANNRRGKTTFVFPSAIQTAFSPFYMASTGTTRSEFQTLMFQQIPTTGALKVLLSMTSPTMLDGNERGWRLAVRLYAPQRQLDAVCPSYTNEFKGLNDTTGNVMEMTAFTEKTAKDIVPFIDEMNAWAKRNVHFMDRPLLESAERKSKKLFIRNADACFTVVLVCGFQCHPEVPFLSSNVSTTGHQFLCFDGRKLKSNMPMLHSSEEDESLVYYAYHEDEEVQLLRIPLKDSPNSDSVLALYVFLPKQRGELSTIMKRMPSDRFIGLLSKCINYQRVRIVLPKMLLECKIPKFADCMKEIGIQRLFDPKAAELASVIRSDGTSKDHQTKSNTGGAEISKSESSTKFQGKLGPARAALKRKQPKRKGRLYDEENPSVTDTVYAAVFQLLDDESLSSSKAAGKSDLASSTPSIGKSTASGSEKGKSGQSPPKTHSAGKEQPGQSPPKAHSPKSTDLESATVSATGGTKSLSGRASNKDKSGKSPTSDSSASKKSKESSSQKGKKSEKEKVETREDCPVCTKIESAGMRDHVQRFVADHPFIWTVVIEKPMVIPLVIGRYCGE